MATVPPRRPFGAVILPRTLVSAAPASAVPDATAPSVPPEPPRAPREWPDELGSPPSADPLVRERAYELVGLLARTVAMARAEGERKMGFLDLMRRAAREGLLIEPRFKSGKPTHVNGLVYRTCSVSASGSELGQVRVEGKVVAFKYRDLAAFGVRPLQPEEADQAQAIVTDFEAECVRRAVSERRIDYGEAEAEYRWMPRYGRQGKEDALDQVRLDAVWVEESRPLRFTVLRRHYDGPLATTMTAGGRRALNIPRGAGKLQQPNSNPAEFPEATIERAQDNPRWTLFDARPVALENSVEALAECMSTQIRPDELIITGAPIDPRNATAVHRFSSDFRGQTPVFRAQTSTFFFADVDGWTAPNGLDVIADRAEVARRYADELLHPAFRGVDLFVQLSASAGLHAVGQKVVPDPTPGDPNRARTIKYYRLMSADERCGGAAKLHIACCLSRPLDDGQRKLLMQYVQAVKGLSIRQGAPDTALAQCVQQHYVHVDWRGMPDPYAAERNTLVRRERRVVDVDAIDWSEVQRVVAAWECQGKVAEAAFERQQIQAAGDARYDGAVGAVRRHLLLAGDGAAPNGAMLQGFRRPMIAAIATGVRVGLSRDTVRGLVDEALTSAPGAHDREGDIADYLSKFDREWEAAERKFGNGANHRDDYASHAGGEDVEDASLDRIEAAAAAFGRSILAAVRPAAVPPGRRPFGAVAPRPPRAPGQDV
ncbi:hypothetical protein [Roseomonas genomospecies 6]|uniref:hypothetical protein n=1 Tax=Roseomonas genomospecies 6 TaxID=214106 RepID=UPI0011F307E8|nr:hypothetical protein [Roseomonas genomospecies 6]